MRKSANIAINYLKCVKPEECAKCLSVCEKTVFNLTFLDKNYHDPQEWRVIPVFPQLCLAAQGGCIRCVEVCPKQAILIEIS